MSITTHQCCDQLSRQTIKLKAAVFVHCGVQRTDYFSAGLDSESLFGNNRILFIEISGPIQVKFPFIK